MRLSVPFLLIFLYVFLNTIRAQEPFFRKVTVSVAPEIKPSLLENGRLLLHFTSQKTTEPRLRSEITMGVSLNTHDFTKPFVFEPKNKDVSMYGLEKWQVQTPEKVYFQAVYKQNIDDGQENGPGNLVSNVDSAVFMPNMKLNLSLNRIIPPYDITESKFIKTVEIKSTCLSEFSDHPRYLKASVLLPAGYFENPGKSYPICYKAPGLNGRYNAVNKLMADKEFSAWWFSGNAPQIIYVFLDSQGPYGDTYQIDSENNGPCGKALTEELIPEIERQVHYNPASKKRFLTGCSTGGWVSLALQILYPGFFDGTWSYSPDPVDFEHYGLINIYADSTVFYNRYGYLQPGKRTIYGEPTFSMKEWIAGENVVSRTNDYRISGGQFGAYNAVFGPKGKDGLPTLMFDPVSGKIDHSIARQWEKYDLKKILEKNWATLGPKLQGKIWIWTGDMDGLYSNVATRFLKAFLDKTENPVSDAKISFTPMAGHCQEWNDKKVLEMIGERASATAFLPGLNSPPAVGSDSASGQVQNNQVWLDELKIQPFSEGVASVVSIGPASVDSILIGKTKQNRGLRVQTTSVISFFMEGNAEQFSAVAGADTKGNASVPLKFYVVGDRKVLFESKEMAPGEPPVEINVSLKGIRRLGLLVTSDREDQFRTTGFWANAKLVMHRDQFPRQIPNDGEKYILTPAPGKKPHINSAAVFGATPGNPFLYAIAATGEPPLRFSVKNLPQGLSLVASTGIISGKVTQKGVYMATLQAKNSYGETEKQLKIVIGDTIALTPPMGWNGWNSWARNIDREKVVASAGAMVKKGLSNHGWTYINIDDTWEGQRGGKFNGLQPNDKFPEFRQMIDTIHAMGLKLGIYSTPWISTYAGYAGASSDFVKGEFPDSIKNNKRSYRRIGKFRFEKEDALQMAEWGVDYLKYDWRIDLNSAERMADALKKSGRDIVLSLSNSAPFELAKEWARVANAWRTGPDIRDSWLSLYISAFTIDKWAPFAGPGHWNDPDMLILGNVTTGTDLHPTRLTPDEQYSHVSLFSLLASPLIIGCPIEQLDPFTLNLLTNDEVIGVNQDPLGKPGRLVMEQDGIQIWCKQLEDGSFAAGLFNTADFGKTPQSYFHWGDEIPKSFTLDLAKIGFPGTYKIRDLWRQKDLGVFNGTFKTEIRHHGVVLIRITPAG